MTAALNWTLMLVFLLSMAANFAIRPDPGKPNIEILPDMAHSIAYSSFTANPILPDGKTLQSPVPGTLPRGFQPLRYRPTPEDALRAGQELKNPLDAGPAKEHGSAVYQNFCTPCHGASLRGDGAVALHGYPAPPNLMGEKSVKLAEGQMFHILTFGQKNMPPHASQLTVNDRWSVIAYVRALQNEGSGATLAATQAPAPSPAAEARK
jgi:mono/diheme cytochrome c family protein